MHNIARPLLYLPQMRKLVTFTSRILDPGDEYGLQLHTLD